MAMCSGIPVQSETEVAKMPDTEPFPGAYVRRFVPKKQRLDCIYPWSPESCNKEPVIEDDDFLVKDDNSFPTTLTPQTSAYEPDSISHWSDDSLPTTPICNTKPRQRFDDATTSRRKPLHRGRLSSNRHSGSSNDADMDSDSSTTQGAGSIGSGYTSRLDICTSRLSPALTRVKNENERQTRVSKLARPVFPSWIVVDELHDSFVQHQHRGSTPPHDQHDQHDPGLRSAFSTPPPPSPDLSTLAT